MKSEVSETISLRTLRRFANALQCDLVYALVPRNRKSLEEIVQSVVYEVARKVVLDTDHHMKLEQQNIDEQELEAQIKDMAQSLYVKFSSELWLLYLLEKEKKNG